MSDDLRTILARVEEELGEDARAALAEAVGLDDSAGSSQSGSSLPADVEEAKDGEMKAHGSGDGEPVTREDLEAALEGAVTEEDLAKLVDDIEASAKEALIDALPGITEEVGQKMTEDVDHAVDVADTYGRGSRATGLEHGRVPTGAASQKMEGDRSESGAVDYTEDIAATFGGGN
jgi:uncharacterized protein YidB (DUF937 family)